MAWYAWTKLRTHGEIKDGVRQGVQNFNPGDEVDKGKLGFSDDEWNQLVESGAVRQEKFPATTARTPSPFRVRMAEENPEEGAQSATNPSEAATGGTTTSKP